MLDVMLKNIREEIYNSIEKLGYLDNNIIPSSESIVLENPKDKKFGDYATNVAMRLAKVAHKAPMIIANEIISNLSYDKMGISSATAAAPGFINLTLDLNKITAIIQIINDKKDDYGKINVGNGQKICLEYVSANPTGYLHVGHGRGAAYGDSLANVMTKAGYIVNIMLMMLEIKLLIWLSLFMPVIWNYMVTL